MAEAPDFKVITPPKKAPLTEYSTLPYSFDLYPPNLGIGQGMSGVGFSLPETKSIPIPSAEKTIAREEKLLKPYKTELQQLGKDLGDFEGEKLLAESESKLQSARVKDAAAEKMIKDMQLPELRAAIKKTSEDISKPFIPTQETAQDVAGLFSLINVVGFAVGAGGKMNAQAALSAMNGMLEGHQKGRDDLYKRQKDIFEENLKQLKVKFDTLMTELNQSMELAKTNYQAAQQKAELAAAQVGFDFVKQNIAKFGLAKAYDTAKEAYGAMQKTISQAIKLEQDAIIKNVQNQNQNARLIWQAQLKAGKSADPGKIQFRYNSALANAGHLLATEISNLSDSVLGSMPPNLGDALTNPSKGVTEAMVRYAGRAMTSAESRAVQQTIANINSAIGAIEASGRPGGVTEARLKELNKIAPQAGDHVINGYLFLAIAKQHMDILVRDLSVSGGTPEQIQSAMQARDFVTKRIPFDASDVYRIIRSDQPRLLNLNTVNMLRTYNNLQAFEQQQDRMLGDQVELAITQAFGSYEPNKYDYRINPDTGFWQRAPKQKVNK